MSLIKVILMGLLLAIPASVVAQRQPVLRQIRVPHSYYYREMYLPQVTSGPSSVTWSPDGQELIYSMQGSLWRQRRGSGEARQLTSGPGYAYQPDWSPDGQHVVYAWYQDDAIALHLLDLRTGELRPLIANGAVNVDPRWAPDGKRIAYVSTAHEGRWHIFVAAVENERTLGPVQRITEDRSSGLPRYYYGDMDQYLSPTWSPDGQDLIFISNRGRIWGSGGFWRMAARPGAEPRELRYEETTWKPRPDWSKDGRRVVYSSYLGGQWHQLWLMTADGGDPFQLTYRQGDATAPRWSPDGKRVAYISNEGGNTSLQVLEVPGGRTERVRAQRKLYREAVGQLRIRVVDRGPGRVVPARVSITTEDGRSFGPDQAWRHADDGFDRQERRFEYGYFHTGGTALVTVPAGAVQVEVSRGPEYAVWRRTVNVKRGSTTPVRAGMSRLEDLAKEGWYSGDLHVHMNYGGAYRNTPDRLVRQAEAEDLHLVENLIVNKEGRIPDIHYFTGRPDPASTRTTVLAHDQEYHTSYWGHTGLLGLTSNIILPAYAAYVNTAAASLFPLNAPILDLARQQDGITGYVHPFDSHPDPGDTSRALTNELPVDVALGKVDYYEALGFVDDYEATARVWYRLLNCGFRLPAGAGTDAMANFASLRGPVGMNRVFVRSGVLDQRRWLAGLKRGRSFATNGPLLGFTLGGRTLGDELALPPGGGDLVAAASLRSYVPVDRLEIIGNGQVVAEIPLDRNRMSVSSKITMTVKESGWYVLRARGNRSEYPVLDVYPYAVTSPIYVTVGGRPIRSRADAEYFIAWIDRLQTGASKHPDWNTEAERNSSMDLLRRAREEFVRRLPQ